MLAHNRQTVDLFFENIAPWDGGYKHVWFSYFAVAKDGINHLIQGALFLNNNPLRHTEDHFEYQGLRAGSFDLAQHGLNKEAFIEQLINGEISTPIGKLVFLINEKRGASGYLDRFQREGLENRSRWTVLTIDGDRIILPLSHQDIDWTLRGADRPFDSIKELLNEYQLGNFSRDQVRVEVFAFHLGEVDYASQVEETEARPAIYLAENLDTSKAAIGYKVVKSGNVLQRGILKGENLLWSENRQYWKRGEGKLAIEAGSVLQLFANYDGVVHHEGWVGNPKSYQNMRRVILDAFDPNLEVLNDYLFEVNKERKFSRDFEIGVALLLDLLGFSVSQIGGSKRLEDSVDIVATTPRHNVVLIECTTGLLNNDNKLSKLFDRASLVRRNLTTSGNGHLKITPVIVTSKSRNDVSKNDLDAAKTLKILVITREDLLSAIERTILQQDPDQLFEEAERSLLDEPLPQ